MTVDGQLRALRRLLYCGEWIESHALHVHLLHAPDFLGYESGIHMARDHAAIVNRGLQLKKVGNDLMTRRRRARDPPDQRARRRLLPRAERRRARRHRGTPQVGARRGARDRCDGWARFRFPGVRARVRLRGAAAPERVRGALGRDRLQPRAESAGRANTSSISPSSTCTRINALHSTLAGPRHVPGRAARALQPELRSSHAHGAGRGARQRPRPHLPQSLQEHRRPRRGDSCRPSSMRSTSWPPTSGRIRPAVPG